MLAFACDYVCAFVFVLRLPSTLTATSCLNCDQLFPRLRPPLLSSATTFVLICDLDMSSSTSTTCLRLRPPFSLFFDLDHNAFITIWISINDNTINILHRLRFPNNLPLWHWWQPSTSGSYFWNHQLLVICNSIHFSPFGINVKDTVYKTAPLL